MKHQYCFAEPADRWALFTEGFARGWLSAVLDFPRFKDYEGITTQAMIECAVMVTDVCCIQNENAYKQLLSSAWATAYVAVTKLPSERQQVFQTYHLKSLPKEEALAFVRDTFLSGDETQAEMKRAYKLIEQKEQEATNG